MDLLQIIAQKRKQIEDIAIEHGSGAKMIRHADLFKKERDAYLERQKQLEKGQQTSIKGLNTEDILDAKLSSKGSDSLSRQEVVRRLRARGQPIRLFGESDAIALKRLRRLEIEKTEQNDGWKNDFQAALSQVENEELMEQVIRGARGKDEMGRHDVQIQENEDDASLDQIVTRAPMLGSGNDQADCDLIRAFLSYILKRWGKQLNAREEGAKRSAEGRLQSLEKYTVNNDIRLYLTNIAKLCVVERNYLVASTAYMEMSIGNAPWPVGVTRSGIHQRPGSSKAYVSNVAHVMNDETQRKYIHGLKRIIIKVINDMDQKKALAVEQLQKALLDAEKSGKYSYEELTSIWEKAKEAIETEDQMVSLYTTFIYLTRRFSEREQSGFDYSKVEALFYEGSNFLEECFEGYSDASIQFDKNSAYFFYTKLKKVDQAREIWNKLLEAEQSAFPWLEAISLERAYGDTQYARRLFFKALDAVTYRQEEIFGRFVQFEREEGTREQLDLALARVNAKVTENNVRMKQQQYKQQKRGWAKASDGQIPVKKNKEKGKEATKKNEKKTYGPNEQRRTETAKAHEQADLGQESGECGEETDRRMETDGDKQRANKNASATFGTSTVPMGPVLPGILPSSGGRNAKDDDEEPSGEKESVEEAMVFESNKREQVTGEKRKRLSNSPENAFPYNTGLEKNKLFVKKLDWACTGEELKRFFEKFGEVVDARIVTKWNGRSKGCAYIEFADKGSASAALMGSDGAEIRGRKIAVFLSNPPLPKRARMETASDQHSAADGGLGSASTSKTVPPTVKTEQNQRKHQQTKAATSLMPRAAFFTGGGQRIGRASRLMLPTSISKRTANLGTEENGASPVGVVTDSTKEMTLQHQEEANTN
uniref:Pre-mRNA-splicing factor 18 n=1 Tax=Globodera rostochiensis TaxID=31243 RepID=A0A914H592_GLORO